MSALSAAVIPAMLWYCVSPNAYFNDHAAELKGRYDGYFFVLWSWDTGVASILGADGNAPTNPDWWPLATRNVAALRAHGITENFAAVTFGSNEEWPSAQLLRSEEWTAKMRGRFETLGRATKAAGFKGVSLDMEYPYQRYALDARVYKYEDYTPGDLVAGAFRQGQATAGGLLDGFPEAIVFVLPGGLRGYPIGERFMLGMLDEMARRNAPGGMHLATEWSYKLVDPVTQAAIARLEDAAMEDLVSPATLRYWRERCSMAPGVWPMRMVEDVNPRYVKRPWAEELADLREQHAILLAASKRYLWTYGGAQMWLTPDSARDAEYHLGGPNFPDAAAATAGWHDILRDRTPYDALPAADPRMVRLIQADRAFNRGELDGDGLCDAFGTPGRWWVLGVLADPHLAPARTAREALTEPIQTVTPYWGRDGWVRWFTWPAHHPTGVVDLNRAFGYMDTDSASAYCATWVQTDRPVDVWLNVGWADGLTVQVGDSVVFREDTFPPPRHYLWVGDRFQFERRIPVHLAAGATRIVCTPMNMRSSFLYTFRVTDADGYPIEGVRFATSDRPPAAGEQGQRGRRGASARGR